MAMINVGTADKPVFVSEEALHPETDGGHGWWQMLASGSITLSEDDLAVLLDHISKMEKDIS